MPDYIHGFHEPGGEHLMADKPGWIVFTEAIGYDPNNHGGADYRKWTDRGCRVIIRLNNGYYPNGTIPERAFYADFAQRVQNFVASSSGAFLWIVGNEPNHEQERPHAQVITAADYAACFGLCAAAIHEVGPQHRAIIAAVAPWNPQTGDWLEYFSEVLIDVGDNADGICLHTYSHGSDPELVTSMATMDPPYQDRLYHFRAYRDFVARIPPELAHLPIYITETNQVQPWEDINNGWVQAAYQEIDEYNQAAAAYGGSVVHCLTLYRWPNFDQWGIADKTKVHEMFTDAVARGYTVPEKGEPPVSENLLVNGGLEHPYEEQLDQNGHPMGTIKVAHGWTAWWYDVAPEYKPVEAQFPNRVKEGATAQQFFKNFDKPNGGLLQIVEGLEPGALYRLTGWVQVWTSGEDDPDYSTGRAWSDIGVSPYGETQPDDPDNLWSTPVRAYDEYVQVSLEFTAPSDRATVFCRSVFEWPMRNQNAYWDALELVRIDDGTEPPDKPPADGECDLHDLYAALAEAASNLAEAHVKNAVMFQELAEGK